MVPWGAPQKEAFREMISALISHPVLTTADWDLPFTLHTDASELAAGAVLTHDVHGREAPVEYGSHRFTRSGEKLSPNDRHVLAVPYGIEQFRTYLQHRRFTLITTGCAALTWLFTCQNLSSKMHRWTLRLMEGEDHTAPDALSRLRRRGPPEPPIDASFPDDTTTPLGNQGPTRPVLDGVSLGTLVPPADDPAPLGPEEHIQLDRDNEPVLNVVSLATLGATKPIRTPGMGLAVFSALQLTPELPEVHDLP